jgi:hypothetical protein
VVAKLDDQMVIDQRGMAFEASRLVLDKQVVPQDDVTPRDEVREMGNVIGLRYDVPDFVPLNDSGEFTAKGPGVDRLPFTRDDSASDPTLVTLTIEQITERKALNRVLAPIVLEARRINMFEAQIDQLLCVTWRVRTQQRNALINTFQRARRAEIEADKAALVAEVTEDLPDDLGHDPSQEEIDKAVEAKIQSLIADAQKEYEKGPLIEDLDAAVAPLLRFDLRPEELIQLQKLGIVTLDSKEIIVRHNKDGIVTPYYRDHPDADPKDNLLSLPHYEFPYVPPPPL